MNRLRKYQNNCFKEAQRATGEHKQLDNMRKTIHEQSKNFNRKVEIIKKNKKKFLKLKKTMNEKVMQKYQ